MQDSTQTNMEIEQISSEGHMMQLRSRGKQDEKPTQPSLCHPSKKISKPRRAKYQKIEDNIRIALLEAVKKRGEKLKTAANRLKINYSSAKSILFTYRKKGRICKKPNGPSNPEDIEDLDVKKEETESETPVVEDVTPSDSAPQKVDSPAITKCDSPSEHSEHQAQPKKVSSYLKCFSKSTSILERIKSFSENMLLEAHNEVVPSHLATKMNGSINGLVNSLEDLICDLQKLGASSGDHKITPSPGFNGFPAQFLPHNAASLFGFHPVLVLRPNPVRNSNQLF